MKQITNLLNSSPTNLLCSKNWYLETYQTTFITFSHPFAANSKKIDIISDIRHVRWRHDITNTVTRAYLTCILDVIQTWFEITKTEFLRLDKFQPSKKYVIKCEYMNLRMPLILTKLLLQYISMSQTNLTWIFKQISTNNA